MLQQELTIAGSYRRGCQDSGDIDVLIKSEDKTTYNKFIEKLKVLKYLVEDLAYGNKKYNGISRLGAFWNWETYRYHVYKTG